MSDVRKYTVRADCYVELITHVEATSEKEAHAIALRRDVTSPVCQKCGHGKGADAHEVWTTRGGSFAVRDPIKIAFVYRYERPDLSGLEDGDK